MGSSQGLKETVNFLMTSYLVLTNNLICNSVYDILTTFATTGMQLHHHFDPITKLASTIGTVPVRIRKEATTA